MTDQTESKDANQQPAKPTVEEKSVTKGYSGRFGERDVVYTATAATQVVEQDEGPDAVFFYVSYTEDDADPADRPIVFAFNGGPGSSSVWLHLGLLGPRRVEMDEHGFRVAKPGGLIENPNSILDVADVVLIDAVGTGFSTASPKGDQGHFHHFTRDIEAFSDFIISYLNRNGRWPSPKYLAGESYGTTRGAAIAANLFDPNKVELNGLVLISSVLNFQTIGQDRDTFLFRPGNDLPYMVFLPTYATTAWYHERLSKKHQAQTLGDLLDEVEAFAIGPYWSALALGDRLGEKEQHRIALRLSEYTGLPTDYIERYDLRIHIHRFCKELMRDDRRTAGRLDSRYTGIDRVSDGDSIETDPASDQTSGPYTATLNDLLRSELGFENDAFYETQSMEVNKSWNYEDFAGHYVDTSERLRNVISRSGLEVFVASGYYDLATPHFATEYTFNHLGLSPKLKEKIKMEYYEAGHMMYLHLPSLERLSGDLRAFISRTH